MAFKRITENDMLGKGNVGKPDTPGVSTSEMQRIMDELPREVIAPAFNELSGQLEADTASADIGANAPDGITPDPAPAENSPAKLQSVLQGIVNKITDHIADQVKHVTSEERTSWNNASNDRHTHDNKSILDGITSSLVGNWNAAFAHVSDAVRHITENERTNWNDKYTKSETDKAINERVVEIGSSDMTKAVYDPETRNLPYIPKIDAEALTLGKNVVLSGTPVSIAYAGAQRIASITAYGETPQGGTTEAPVALTGVDSVLLGGNNLLPKATETKTLNGVTFTPNPDGSVSVSGTATNNAAYVFANGLDDSLFGQTVCLSGGSMQTQLIINEKKPSGEWLRNVITNAKTPTAVGVLSKQVDDNILYGTIYVPTGTTVNTTIYPMLNLGNTAMPYEPYQGSVTPLPIPRPLRRVGDVKDKCVTRQDYESAEKLVVTYNVGFVELDGTEASHIFEGMFYLDYSASWPTPANRVNGVCSHYPYNTYGKGEIGLTANGNSVVYNSNGDYTADEAGIAAWKAYLAAQKAAGTPVQIAYQLATPEVYATDPLDIDNAAGPLTVMTGGKLEVRMTELIGSRSDVSNNTVAFSEASQDADISSGEKLSVLFGKIKKRFEVIAYNLSNIYNKTESDERYATAAQGEKADNALPKTGGTISGNLTVVQDLTVQRAFNGMRIKAGVKVITTTSTTNRAELFTSDQLNTLFGTSGVTYDSSNSVVVVANGDYAAQSKNITAGFVNSKWAIFSADGSNLLTGGLRVNYIAIKFA